eukprot:2422079-Pyramimonas_sp.AAC.1
MAAHYFKDAVSFRRRSSDRARPIPGKPRSLSWPPLLFHRASHEREGYDLDDPTIPRHPDGPITRPPSGGLGCSACAGNANMRFRSHDRDPRHCR